MRLLPTWKSVLLLAVLTGVALPGFAQDDEKLDRKQVSRALDLAKKLVEEGKPGEAGGYYLAVIDSYPDRADVRILLARIYRDFGEWANAAEHFEKALEGLDKEEEIAEAYEALTEARTKEGKFGDAVEWGKKAIEANPSSTTAMLNLALSLAKTGNLTEAASYAEQALALEPNSALAHTTLGEAGLAEGNLDAAEASFRKAIEIEEETADAHIGLADILFRKEEYDAAVASASRALELNDKLTRAYSIRGISNNALGDPAKAQSDLAMAITVNPDDPDANLAYAQVYRSQNNRGMAESYYIKAVDLRKAAGLPTLPEANLELADVLIQQGKHTNAVQYLQQAVEAVPDSAQANLLLGVCMERAKDYDGALTAFTKAAELDAGLGDAHYNKGKILLEQKKDIANALAALETAVGLDGANSDYLTQYGVALYQGKQLEPALENLRKAAASPEYADPMGLTFLGIALKDKQEYAESAQNFEKAIEAFPTWGLPHWGLAWSSFGQIAKGCPCTPEDEALVQALVEHSQKAAELGVNDPDLAERAEILGKGEKVK